MFIARNRREKSGDEKFDKKKSKTFTQQRPNGLRATSAAITHDGINMNEIKWKPSLASTFFLKKKKRKKETLKERRRKKRQREKKESWSENVR